jgi:hypothetical protein
MKGLRRHQTLPELGVDASTLHENKCRWADQTLSVWRWEDGLELSNAKRSMMEIRVWIIKCYTFDDRTVLAEHKRIPRTFVPFMTSPNMECTLTGAFFAGYRPCWIMATDKGGLRVVPSGHTVFYAFTACSLWESKAILSPIFWRGLCKYNLTEPKGVLEGEFDDCVLYAEKSRHSLAHALGVPLSLNGHQKSNLTVLYHTAAFLNLAHTPTLYLNHRRRW